MATMLTFRSMEAENAKEWSMVEKAFDPSSGSRAKPDGAVLSADPRGISSAHSADCPKQRLH
eukprot:3423718-Pyramimonas_sp.AAC.1